MLKLFRGILLALLASLLLGLVIGTVIRLRLERPVIYFVYHEAAAANAASTESPRPSPSARPRRT